MNLYQVHLSNFVRGALPETMLVVAINAEDAAIQAEIELYGLGYHEVNTRCIFRKREN